MLFSIFIICIYVCIYSLETATALNKEVYEVLLEVHKKHMYIRMYSMCISANYCM